MKVICVNISRRIYNATHSHICQNNACVIMKKDVSSVTNTNDIKLCRWINVTLNHVYNVYCFQLRPIPAAARSKA
jgi:hypothetical protein